LVGALNSFEKTYSRIKWINSGQVSNHNIVVNWFVY